MTFTVRLDALAGYDKQITRAVDDVRAAQRYLARYGRAEESEGFVYQRALSGNNHAVAAADAVLSRLMGLLDASGQGLVGAARYYQGSDGRTAARFDAALPLAPCPTGGEVDGQLATIVCRPGAFEDVRVAQDRLEAPEAPEEPGSNPLGITEVTSVSAVVSYFLKDLFGFDPIEWAASRVLGDWEKIYECGVAYGHLAEFCEDVALNLDFGAHGLGDGWQGNAADAAAGYFRALAGAVAALAEPWRKLDESHKEMAEAAWRAAEAVKGCINILVDHAIIAASEAAAGSLLAETGVGLVVADAAAAYEIVKIYETVDEMMKIVHVLQNLVMTAGAAVDATIGLFDGGAVMTLPAVPYAFPGAHAAPSVPRIGPA